MEGVSLTQGVCVVLRKCLLLSIALLVTAVPWGVSLPMFCLHRSVGISLEEPVPFPLLICSVIYLNQCVPGDTDIIYGL